MKIGTYTDYTVFQLTPEISFSYGMQWGKKIYIGWIFWSIHIDFFNK